jgi:transposase-like protein
MSDLVDVAISAHGGLDRWRQRRPVSASLRVGGALWALTGKYLHNVVEQDHRGVKRVTRPMLEFTSFAAAQDTLAGIALMHMLKKGRMAVEEGAKGLTPAEPFYTLAA